MATVFFFYLPRECLAEQYAFTIHSRGDFIFKYKIIKIDCEWVLRMYNLQNLNNVLLDLLDREFAEMGKYSGYLKITRAILDDCHYDSMLGLARDERCIVRAICLQQEESDALLDLICRAKARK